ncbi:hypothetical protein Dsin_018446 [Dipteronia sinensis]|uniref:Uncharacterized protein n=1 Tax=Dipteronia sinensis TaxID=43782 RepID=A0AAE0E1T2_9ROSI|nr:hypothetical protein Dsin_018446 [Dipteronia sinensis]
MMPNSKVRPIVAFNWAPTMNRVESHDDHSHAQITNKWEEFDYFESGISRHDRDYWHTRRAFLNSYRFTEHNEYFKGKLKRSMKELNNAAMGVVLDIRKEMSKRKVGFRVFRFKFALSSSMVLVSIRCFTPWLGKKRVD